MAYMKMAVCKFVPHGISNFKKLIYYVCENEANMPTVSVCTHKTLTHKYLHSYQITIVFQHFYT